MFVIVIFHNCGSSVANSDFLAQEVYLEQGTQLRCRFQSVSLRDHSTECLGSWQPFLLDLWMRGCGTPSVPGFGYILFPGSAEVYLLSSLSPFHPLLTWHSHLPSLSLLLAVGLRPAKTRPAIRNRLLLLMFMAGKRCLNSLSP